MRITKHTLGPSVAVCLGSGVTATGTASETTLLRLIKALEMAKANPEMTIIVSGDGRREKDPVRRNAQKTEAAVMAEYLIKNEIAADRILIEDESVDTIGNAILTVQRYLQGETPRPLLIITSPFHARRSQLSFTGVLGPLWPITMHTCGEASDDKHRGANEQGGIDWTNRLFEGLQPGDLPAVIAKLLLVGKPYYKTVVRLQPQAC